MPPLDPWRSDTKGDGGAYWFPAKKYGWGWGLPATWQGWVFMTAWLAIVAVGLLVLVSRHDSVGWLLLYIWIMTLVMLLVCYWKGEPPRWRWGDRSSSNGR